MATRLAPGPCETQTYHVHSSLDALETELFFSFPVCPWGQFRPKERWLQPMLSVQVQAPFTLPTIC